MLLETIPVDPRDLLRGDFVILNYPISRLDAKLFRPEITNAPDAGTRVYVTLTPVGEYHLAQSASFNPPAPGSGLTLEGTVQPDRFSGPRSSEPLSVEVEYGLERYYVREGTGNPSGKLTVLVAIPRSGQGVIKEVYLDGQPYAEVMQDQAR